mmetsp:Transcript_37543/g.107275  ORF Transcript_37543/g.107275 Transcript_37543/m.107275 type:complete len:168 (-) Transcript_37543:921-1424(-)
MPACQTRLGRVDCTVHGSGHGNRHGRDSVFKRGSHTVSGSKARMRFKQSEKHPGLKNVAVADNGGDLKPQQQKRDRHTCCGAAPSITGMEEEEPAALLELEPPCWSDDAERRLPVRLRLARPMAPIMLLVLPLPTTVAKMLFSSVASSTRTTSMNPRAPPASLSKSS